MKRLIRSFRITLSLTLCFLITTAAEAQHSDWTQKERRYYQVLDSFCYFLVHENFTAPVDPSVLGKYVNLDYIENDSSGQRRQARLQKLGTLIRAFKKYLDSVGLEHLDAQPVRFYQQNGSIYQPFARELKNQAGETFAYYNKSDPGQPCGFLLFDPGTGKLLSWLLIDQGGYRYFLTMNLL